MNGRNPTVRLLVSSMLAAVAGLPGGAGAATGDCMAADASAWLTDDAQRKLYRELVAYMACRNDDPASGALADQVACNYFVGKVMSDIYGIDDFSTGQGKWLLANEIHAYVSGGRNGWSRLGLASDQRVLDDAAAGAANGQPVVAVAKGDPGHVAIVLPGMPRASSSWGGLRVPNSAAFSLGHVDRAYVFCRLSYAFAAPGDVEIFWRVKP